MTLTYDDIKNSRSKPIEFDKLRKIRDALRQPVLVLNQDIDFDFSCVRHATGCAIPHDEAPNLCNSAGCAVGLLPDLFPNDFEFTRLYPAEDYETGSTEFGVRAVGFDQKAQAKAFTSIDDARVWLGVPDLEHLDDEFDEDYEQDWQIRHEIHTMENTDSPYLQADWCSVRHALGLTANEMSHLFMPDEQKPTKFGGQPVSFDAKASEVADNIDEFIRRFDT